MRCQILSFFDCFWEHFGRQKVRFSNPKSKARRFSWHIRRACHLGVFYYLLPTKNVVFEVQNSINSRVTVPCLASSRQETNIQGFKTTWAVFIVWRPLQPMVIYVDNPPEHFHVERRKNDQQKTRTLSQNRYLFWGNRLSSACEGNFMSSEQNTELPSTILVDSRRAYECVLPYKAKQQVFFATHMGSRWDNILSFSTSQTELITPNFLFAA